MLFRMTYTQNNSEETLCTFYTCMSLIIMYEAWKMSMVTRILQTRCISLFSQLPKQRDTDNVVPDYFSFVSPSGWDPPRDTFHFTCLLSQLNCQLKFKDFFFIYFFSSVRYFSFFQCYVWNRPYPQLLISESRGHLTHSFDSWTQWCKSCLCVVAVKSVWADLNTIKLVWNNTRSVK